MVQKKSDIGSEGTEFHDFQMKQGEYFEERIQTILDDVSNYDYKDVPVDELPDFENFGDILEFFFGGRVTHIVTLESDDEDYDEEKWYIITDPINPYNHMIVRWLQNTSSKYPKNIIGVLMRRYSKEKIIENPELLDEGQDIHERRNQFLELVTGRTVENRKDSLERESKQDELDVSRD